MGRQETKHEVSSTKLDEQREQRNIIDPTHECPNRRIRIGRSNLDLSSVFGSRNANETRTRESVDLRRGAQEERKENRKKERKSVLRNPDHRLASQPVNVNSLTA